MRVSATSEQSLRDSRRKMLIEKPARIVRYGISLASVGLAFLVASLLPSRADPSHFTLFFAATMISAWFGGLGPELLATVLSALSLDYFFFAPIHSITLDWRAVLRLGVFSIVADSSRVQAGSGQSARQLARLFSMAVCEARRRMKRARSTKRASVYIAKPSSRDFRKSKTISRLCEFWKPKPRCRMKR
jgi:K+-sensing histidine kinase KdpD